MNRYIRTILSISLFLLLISGVAFAQCPMCKAGVESSAKEGASNMAEGLNTGIMYLFILPYLLISGVAIFWYRGYRKKKKAGLEA